MVVGSMFFVIVVRASPLSGNLLVGERQKHALAPQSREESTSVFFKHQSTGVLFGRGRLSRVIHSLKPQV